ncbi:MAG: hypothetical protein WBX15_03455 [Thermoanaerobaculia bacterium]
MPRNRRSAASFRKETNQESGSIRGRLRRAAGRLRETLGSIRENFSTSESTGRRQQNPAVRTKNREAEDHRPPRRMPNVDLSPLDASSASQQSKSSAEPQRHAHHYIDQEAGVAMSSESRWADEDRYTNRSHDPRIGTHGRSYDDADREEARNR